MNLKTLPLNLYIITVLLVGLYCGVSQARSEELDVSQASTNEEQLVVVEPSPVLLVKEEGSVTYKLVPYKLRRPGWTKVYSLGASNYFPKEYALEFSALEMENAFKDGATSTFKADMSFQKNWEVFSFGFDFGAAYYSARADENNDFAPPAINLSIGFLMYGARFNLDGLFDEPYVTAYVGGGGYTAFYSEKLQGADVTGQTAPAPYWLAGLRIQLNPLAPNMSRIAYQESEIQNAFLFVEAQNFMKSSLKSDPNFASGTSINAGLALEL